MTPHVVARLTIHEPEGAASIAAPRFRPGLRSIEAPALIARPRPGLSGARRGVRLRREAVQRRLLAAADLIGAAVALGLVAGVPAVGGQPGLLLFAAVPLVVAVFKIAGLYDRDQLRLVHSTLDETPLLLQLTGLYVLGVVIAQSILISGTLGGDPLAALWVTTLLLVVAGRMAARWVGGRATPTQR